MKRILLLTVFLISACASGPKFSWESQWVDRQDGIYGDWTTSNKSNEFSTWTSSKVLGSKGGLFSNQSFIEVQSGRNTNTFVGIDIGDGYICGPSVVAQLAWQSSDGRKIIEPAYLKTSKNNEKLIFSDRGTVQWVQERFLHFLNSFDKLTIQTEDTCGETTIVRFGIEGTHHMTTKQTSSDGMTNVNRSERNVSDHIKYHNKPTFGFNFQNLSDDERRALGRDTGVKVIQVVSGSPVDIAGLLVGDYAIFLDGQPLYDVAATVKWIDGIDYRKRSKAKLTIIRDGQTRQIEVDLQGNN